MKKTIPGFILVLFFMVSVAFLPRMARAEEPKAFVPDKTRCGEMIRFGKQAYDRGKFLDAKAYFRQAVEADPTSQAAWRHYDLSVVSALAEKVNKNSDLLAPDSEKGRTQPSAGAASPPPPPPPVKKQKPVVQEDEGC